MTGRHLHFAANMRESRRIRADVRAAAAALGAAEDVCDVLALVVDELVNNAIEHGASYRQTGQDLRRADDLLHLHRVVGVEADEVEAAEGRGVLVLLADRLAAAVDLDVAGLAGRRARDVRT